MSSSGIQRLVSWAKDNGALISPNVGFEEISPNNIGAVYRNVKGDFSKDYDIRIPISIILTLQKAIEFLNIGIKNDEICEIAKKSSNTNSLLKLYLARERTKLHLPQSPFKEYISLLPELKAINSPYCWNSELKEYIKGTNLGNSLKENIGQLVEEWWQLINLLPQDMPKPEEHFINMKFYYEYKFYKDEDLYRYFVVDENIDNWTSFPNYLWASLIVKSRSFPSYLLKDYVKSTSDIKEDEAMLLPVIDLLNHDMSAKVNWVVRETNGQVYFDFKSDSVESASQLYNNYGMKGNEELLLAYGFCIEDNSADSAALKIKIPLHILPEVENQGVSLPKISDYTTSVVRNGDSELQNSSDLTYKQYEDGLLFFVTNDYLPENLIHLFQVLVKNKWENEITLRMKLAGLNQLRSAIDSKVDILSNISLPQGDDENIRNIRIYVQSQRKILAATVKKIKRIEKELLTDPINKPSLITLKNVYKKDKKLQQALLISLGLSSYDNLLENQFQDQYWLLYLIRCYNRKEYIKTEEDEEENYLPKWIGDAFQKLRSQTEVTAAEILQYKNLYQSLIPQLSMIVPEIFGKGSWTVNDLVISAKLLDLISFVRGKDQECILVKTL